MRHYVPTSLTIHVRGWSVEVGILALVSCIAVAVGREKDAPNQKPAMNAEKSDEATDTLRVHSESLKEMNIDKVRELVDAGANVNVRNKYNATPLYMASAKGETDIVKLLLRAKADVNASPVAGATPLLVAADNEHTEIVKLLLDANASVNPPKESKEQPGNSRPRYLMGAPFVPLSPGLLTLNPTQTGVLDALWVASCKGYPDIVKLLLEAKANVFWFSVTLSFGLLELAS